MTKPGLRVVKVGGSLFEYPSLATALTKWLNQEPPMRNILITGGGIWADEVRHLEGTGRLSPEAAHWLAIRTMKLTGWLLCQMLPAATWMDRQDLLCVRQLATDVQTIVIDPERFLQHVEPWLPPSPLPIGWHVTSDSIAARVAEVTGADELVLMKSMGIPAATLQAAAHLGAVDAYFPSMAARLQRLRWVNLRELGGSSACS